jgi:hypothetical protein
MLEKPKHEPAPEDDIEVISRDFKQLFGEMTDITSIRQFSGIFKQLHSLLMDSHGKNQQLTATVQKLNVQIISNATKVASLLKMSEDDQRSIERTRTEYDSAWRLVSSSQANELRTLELCETLRSEVARLQESIHNQEAAESAFDQLKLEITNYSHEAATRIHEIELLNGDLDLLRASQASEVLKLEQTNTTMKHVTEDIKTEEQTYATIKASSLSFHDTSLLATEQHLEATQLTEDNKTLIQSKHRVLAELREEAARFSGIRKDTEADHEAAQRVVHEAHSKHERILSFSDRTEKRLAKAQNQLERLELDFDGAEASRQKWEALTIKREKEFEELQQSQALLEREMRVVEAQRRALSREIAVAMRKRGYSEGQVQQRVRDCDARCRNVGTLAGRVLEAEQETSEAADQSRVVAVAHDVEKNGLRELKLKAVQVENEKLVYEGRLRDTKVQVIRLEDVGSVTQTDISHAMRSLDTLSASIKQHDQIIQAIQKERDHISNDIEAAKRENERVSNELRAKRELVSKLKRDIDQKTADCITVHFQTRSVEKSIAAMSGAAEMTTKLIDDARVAILRYKAEGMKLRVILDEAIRDIGQAKAESLSVFDICTMLERQLSGRNQEVTQRTEEISTAEYILEHHAAAYERQSDSIAHLQDDLGRAAALHRILTNRASAAHMMTFEIIGLEAKFQREREMRDRYEQELSRPINVHRWTIMKAMAPERYQQIAMVQYIKAKIEDAYREEMKLQAQKADLNKRLRYKVDRMKRVHIEDGSYALSVFRERLSQKDTDLRAMDVELRESRDRSAAYQMNINTIQQQLVQSHSATTAMKRKKMERPDIPVLPLGPKFVERSRLGGGFDLSARKDTTPKPHVVLLTEEAVAQISARDSVRRIKVDGHDIRPSSARSEEVPTNWRPHPQRTSKPKAKNANPELSIVSVMSSRQNFDDELTRKRPQKTAPAGTNTSGSSSARSSGRSARASGAQSSRPQVKVHTAVIRF